MFNLVSTLGQEMGEAYPDLIRAQPAIESAFQQEEQSFQRTLGRGLALLDEATKSNLWFIANVSQNAFGPHARPDMVARWQDPEFRESMSKMMQSRVISDETKRKMSLAKQGANNAKARKVIVTNPDRSETTFSTTTEAAQFFRISQQLLHLMLKGKTAWPGKGKFIRNKENAWMREYEARLV
jgi:hypothetical protein